MTTEIIDDLVILGRAVPERLKNGRATVCLGGWSQSKGFIRIYPTRPKMDIHQWDVIRVEVERNQNDSREESWKIVGSQSDWDNLYQRVETIGKIKDPYEKRAIIESGLSSCVNVINDARRSLGIIKPEQIHRTYFGENAMFNEPHQEFLFADVIDDFENWLSEKRDYEVEPRVRYTCPDCQTKQGYHDQAVLDWGFHEWMRKNPTNMEQVWKNARVGHKDYDVFFFVGNLANHRTAFLIISVLWLKKNLQPRLF